MTSLVQKSTPVQNASQEQEPSWKQVVRQRPLFDPHAFVYAFRDAFLKLNPFTQVQNPVLFAVECGAAVLAALLIRDGIERRSISPFELQVTFWVWLTVLLANFAEAYAEYRGKAEADLLRRSRGQAVAHRVTGRSVETVAASRLRTDDIVVVESGELIPADGELVDGIAMVDESVITGESAPVIRESGGDRGVVTSGTRILSEAVRIRITSPPGETFVDRMIALMEGAERESTPNEKLTWRLVLWVSAAVVVVLAAVYPLLHPGSIARGDDPVAETALFICLLVCLLPTTIAGLLSAIGIAGMDHIMQHNVLAASRRAIELAGNVDILLLDKTGTVTLGNREAIEFLPFAGVSEQELALAAQYSSIGDETPEGRSIVALATSKYGLPPVDRASFKAEIIPFSAYTCMSGVESEDRSLRKGASSAMARHVEELGGQVPPEFQQTSDEIARTGDTPLAVADGARALGMIHLKDVVKGGMRGRVGHLRELGVRTVMITGDNPLTAAAIAHDANVDEYLAQATPADKLAYIKRVQREGRVIAMTGDGTNDAPALAQADIGLTMETGTNAAKEAGNMVDLDSNPTKFIEVVEVAKQVLMTRAALTAFSLASSLGTFVAILPVLIAVAHPAAAELDLLRLRTVHAALLSALMFNALSLLFSLPAALHGIKLPQAATRNLMRRELVLYAMGGLIAPFPGIWLLARLLSILRLA